MMMRQHDQQHSQIEQIELQQQMQQPNLQLQQVEQTREQNHILQHHI
jgi:hypothetical protein